MPGGSFAMGAADGQDDEKPVHEVTLAPFEMSRSEVTVRQYRACVLAGACSEPHADDGSCHVPAGGRWAPGVLPETFLGEEQPVVCVDFGQARQLACWAGKDGQPGHPPLPSCAGTAGQMSGCAAQEQVG